MAEIRLFVEGPLAENKVLPLDVAQSNYLFGVMRRKVGDSVSAGSQIGTVASGGVRRSSVKPRWPPAKNSQNARAGPA